MRETRLSGSEGGGVANTRSPHPYFMSSRFAGHANHNARCPAKNVGHAQTLGERVSRLVGTGEGSWLAV